MIISHSLMPLTSPASTLFTSAVSSTHSYKYTSSSPPSLLFSLIKSFLFRYSQRVFFPLPLEGCVVEMEQCRAVLAAVKADTDLICRILIQRGLDGFQRRLHFLTQRCACGAKKPTSRGSFTFYFVRYVRVFCKIE